eukprot:TRINITY_DN16257_c0_g1_i1.p1 TRINITY_DN16257_c0_g1~~TRINITY_DN16257_c0_g1_i1.p1  ORF type:complete len:260 (+),score=96.63 TRINITY_DN16257_c0_g1_i1:42-821(+)
MNLRERAEQLDIRNSKYLFNSSFLVHNNNIEYTKTKETKRIIKKLKNDCRILEEEIEELQNEEQNESNNATIEDLKEDLKKRDFYVYEEDDTVLTSMVFNDLNNQIREINNTIDEIESINKSLQKEIREEKLLENKLVIDKEELDFTEEKDSIDKERFLLNTLKKQNSMFAENIRSFVTLYLPSNNPSQDSFSVSSILEKLINLHVFGTLEDDLISDSFLCLDSDDFDSWNPTLQILNKYRLILFDPNHHNRVKLNVVF